MSFYGNIKRVQSSPYVFDKYYPSRKAMEAAVKGNGEYGDDVYVGRYVLVTYRYNDEKFVDDEDNPGSKRLSDTYRDNLKDDTDEYSDSFNNTVWQKIYTNVTSNDNPTGTPTYKYILVAELDAAVPRLELDVVSPKYYGKENEDSSELTEIWAEPEIRPEASTEDAYTFQMPNVLHLDVGDMGEDFYAKDLVSNPGWRYQMTTDGVSTKDESANANHIIDSSSMYGETYNYMKWTNQTKQDDGSYKDTVVSDNAKIDGKKLDTKLYAFGQMISDLYDILYGKPAGGTGPRPFYTEDLAGLLANYDKGLVGILTSLNTDIKGDAAQDTYGRSMQPGMYYYFTSKWGDATEDPDSFIENIPQVIGSTTEFNEGKSHYYIKFNGSNANVATLESST